eukprot:7886413-Pyramimonas_sp.AAC.2
MLRAQRTVFVFGASFSVSVKKSGGELNSPVVESLNKGLMDNPRLWRFFSVRKYLRGELYSAVVEWVNKGLTAVWSPRRRASLPNLRAYEP